MEELGSRWAIDPENVENQMWKVEGCQDTYTYNTPHARTDGLQKYLETVKPPFKNTEESVRFKRVEFRENVNNNQKTQKEKTISLYAILANSPILINTAQAY